MVCLLFTRSQNYCRCRLSNKTLARYLCKYRFDPIKCLLKPDWGNQTKEDYSLKQTNDMHQKLNYVKCIEINQSFVLYCFFYIAFLNFRSISLFLGFFFIAFVLLSLVLAGVQRAWTPLFFINVSLCGKKKKRSYPLFFRHLYRSPFLIHYLLFILLSHSHSLSYSVILTHTLIHSIVISNNQSIDK